MKTAPFSSIAITAASALASYFITPSMGFSKSILRTGNILNTAKRRGATVTTVSFAPATSRPIVASPGVLYGSSSRRRLGSPLLFAPHNFFHTNGDESSLPWTPIRETERGAALAATSSSKILPYRPSIKHALTSTTTRLHMKPHHGTEGFRDAIRGGQGYITPRGGNNDGVEDRGNRGVARRGQPLVRKGQQQQQQQQPPPPEQQPSPQSSGYSFPKLTPGHQHDINAQPPTNTPSPVDEATQKQQARILQMKQRQQVRTARLNVLAQGGRKKPPLLADAAADNPKVVDLMVGEEVCDPLDPTSKDHCLENFREGRESAQYMKSMGLDIVLGGTGKRNIFNRIDSSVSRKGVGDSAVSTVDISEEEKDGEGIVQDSMMDASPRAGRKEDDVSGVLEVTRSEQEDATESIKDGRVDGESLPSTSRVDRFDMIRGPLSENFRNGARMATFKQPEFMQVSKVSTTSFNFEEEEEEEEELDLLEDDFDSSFEDIELELEELDHLVDGGEVFNNDDIVEEENDDVYNRTADVIADYFERQQKLMEDKSEEDHSTSHDSGTAVSGKSPPKLLSIDPNSIQIIPLDEVRVDGENESLSSSVSRSIQSDFLENASPSKQYSMRNLQGAALGSFVKMFRGSASYIANHRGTLAVYHIPGELLAWEGFPGLMDDIALTWLLGMKIVLVAGCRHQIDIRLEDGDDVEHHIGGKVMMSSIRVTDEDTLRVVKEEAGFVRFEIERRLARSLRMHGALVKGSENLVGNVVSGNFYSAQNMSRLPLSQPFGVLDGIDYCWSGFPRKVEIERIRQVHETNDIVLLTSLGVSPSGEIFNVNSEFLAATAAGALGASKIIYFNVHGTSFQNKITKKPVQNLRVSDARNLLAHYKMRIHPKGFALVDLDEDSPHQVVLRAPGSMETLIKVGYSMVALEKGVKRAHILAPENGALVQELYTRDGCGTLISRDIYEGIRRADVNDVSGIYELIEPLVRSGTLVERPKSQLEKEVLSYYVYTLDGLVVATGQLKRFEGGFAEIGCLVVSKDYRRGGRGDAMLGYLERLALQCGASKVFVLSTQTMEWFVERGFKEVPVAR
eukprot:CCRYP_006152-RB/>CCRYP_006152-RB protein AED:0.06 eAED:0.06 QI:137/0.66/0.75/1/0.66/0.75/4/635/1078